MISITKQSLRSYKKKVDDFDPIADPEYIVYLNRILYSIIESNGHATCNMLIDQTHKENPGIKKFCDENTFSSRPGKDKGYLGKYIEFWLFKTPTNSRPETDLLYGDLKTTNFKRVNCSKNAYNAKERLTLTNVGDPNGKDIIAYMSQSNIKSICDTKYYNKIKSGVIVVLEHNNNTSKDVKDQRIIAIVRYDLDEIFKTNNDIASVFQDDFDKIKKCIVERNVSQRGQQYLHIHPHGCKGSKTRAFGFTSRFLTWLVSHTLEKPIMKKGRTEYIEL